MHIPHAVSSMAKYEREQREMYGDGENASAVIGKFEDKGVRVDTARLPELHEALERMFLQRRTNGEVMRTVEARVSEDPHPKYGACPADRAFGELLVGVMIEHGAEFEGEAWWRK
jgi:hypothetical protein